MRRTLAIVLVATGCFRVGPVKVGLVTRGFPDASEPDRTRNFIAEPVQPNGEGGVAAAGKDPSSAGPVSGGVTLASLALWTLAGLPTMIGMYGTFDETGIVELDDEKRAGDASRSKLRAKAAQEGRDEPLDAAGPAREE